MKKIIVFLLICCLAVTMTSCGNMAVGLGNFTFEKVHVDSHHYSGCFTIERWHDNETGIEVRTKEAGNLYLSEGTYFLIEEECPFCGHEKGE